MAIRKIRTEGDEILRKKSREVTSFDDKLHTLFDDMYETMLAAPGLGLAAVQVGVLRRVAVIEIDGQKYELVNPEVVEREGEDIDIEGCLSLPEFYGTVKRPLKIKVKYKDRFGKEQQAEVEGYAAHCFCHELDHMDGILFRDIVIEEVNPADIEENEGKSEEDK
ncbi:MAG TPA: peptide deformylase [Clostridia bacterium]|jgi:peptide deformylase|nr:MAG: Peptide deformylase [Firmicutes bacterium ADurb.Bin146]HOD92653.1 peptide deformylase [Clostridia bacterium]HQM39843.1 peptide deformylase [Clostridia bacterium]